MPGHQGDAVRAAPGAAGRCRLGACVHTRTLESREAGALSKVS